MAHIQKYVYIYLYPKSPLLNPKSAGDKFLIRSRISSAVRGARSGTGRSPIRRAAWILRQTTPPKFPDSRGGLLSVWRWRAFRERETIIEQVVGFMEDNGRILRFRSQRRSGWIRQTFLICKFCMSSFHEPDSGVRQAAIVQPV